MSTESDSKENVMELASQQPGEGPADCSTEVLLSRLAALAQKNRTDEFGVWWDELFQRAKKQEISRLGPLGAEGKKIGKLVRTKWACADPGDAFLTTQDAPSNGGRWVRVVEVFHENGFIVEPSMALLMRSLFGENSRDFEKRGPGCREGVMAEIAKMEAVFRETYPGGMSATEEIAMLLDPNRVEAAFGVLALSLRKAIGRAVDAADQSPCREAVVQELFSIVEMSIKAGRALERHRLLLEQGGGAAMRMALTNPPGKQLSPKGTAIAPLFEEYERSDCGNLTATKFAKWLGAKRPMTDENPLSVSHILWGKELQDVSWTDLKNLIRSYKRRKKRQ